MTRLVYLAALASEGRLPPGVWLSLSCADRMAVWRLSIGMRRAAS